LEVLHEKTPQNASAFLLTGCRLFCWGLIKSLS
jgi:hypothetical protein